MPNETPTPKNASDMYTVEGTLKPEYSGHHNSFVDTIPKGYALHYDGPSSGSASSGTGTSETVDSFLSTKAESLSNKAGGPTSSGGKQIPRQTISLKLNQQGGTELPEKTRKAIVKQLFDNNATV